MAKKFLIIRFSSIGDIVLTTSVVRCLKEQIAGCEVHYLTKSKFKSVVENNVYIDKIYTIDKDINEVIEALKIEHYDHVLDMHKSLRSISTCWQLQRPHSTYNKTSIRKWIYYKTGIDLLPKIHIVDRYFKAFSKLGIQNDFKGLDYFLTDKDTVELPFAEGYTAIVTGATYFTKQIPVSKIIEFCNAITTPIVLLGGKDEIEKGETICMKVNNPNVSNACGKYSLNQSAYIVKNAKLIITSDTGLMHIAAAFNKRIISLWGTTSPRYGVAPYMPQNPSNSIVCNLNLRCSPCSKFGLDECPKKHFNCMLKMDTKDITTVN